MLGEAQYQRIGVEDDIAEVAKSQLLSPRVLIAITVQDVTDVAELITVVSFKVAVVGKEL